jgi:hypothetical protein
VEELRDECSNLSYKKEVSDLKKCSRYCHWERKFVSLVQKLIEKEFDQPYKPYQNSPWIFHFGISGNVLYKIFCWLLQNIYISL